jgi:serine/threonine-protein phosphatase 6 regulatory ankyrin repeat subunit B
MVRTYTLGLVWAAAVGVCLGAPDTKLVDAARTQDAAVVKSLVGAKADLNAKASDGSTALLWAAHWDDLTSGELLVTAGADPNLANEYGMTPLSQACTNASVGFVRLLLKSGAKVNAPIATGETPLMTCSRTGNVEAVKLLIEYGAAVDAKESTQNQTAIMWAAAEKHSDIVKALIAAHADLKAQTKQGFPPIHFAARVGDLESVKALLAAGVDVNLLTGAEGAANGGRGGGTAGLTALLVATFRAQVDTALYLLDHGADPNNLASGIAPLHWAATTWEGYAANPVYGFEDPMSGIWDRAAKFKLVKALLAHGADVNLKMQRRPSFATGYTDVQGATAFLLASSTQDVEMMKLLLDAGADPKIKTATNASSLMAATGLNHGIGESLVTEKEAIAAVKMLLDLGVDPKGETTFNENALFGPAYRGWNTLLAQMIDLGVNVNAVSKAGVTPYRAANGQGDRLGGVLYNKEGVELLLKHGADPNLGTACEAQNKCRELK